MVVASSSPRQVIAGFMRLTDCAPLLVAAKMGFAASEGVDLVLHRETSWATIRDKISVGHFDVAHMLAPMPIAQNLGLTPLSSFIIVPMALGFGSNTVALSNELLAGLERHGSGRLTVAESARAFAATVRSRAQQGRKTVLGIVHPHSAHHYELAYWMGSAGIVPSRDVDLVVLPPSLMADAISAEQIDGFCAGEPWGSVAVMRGVGRIVTTKGQIWRSSPEKVLGVSKAWADRNEETLMALMRAIYKAALWCDEDANRRDVVTLLSRPDCLDLPPDVIEPALLGSRKTAETVPDRMIFADKAATFPWISHALWFYAQMARWRQLSRKPDDEAIVRATFRPDLYRSALGPLRIGMPSANSKVEGSLEVETPVGSAEGRLMLGPDGFFDGRIFDPDLLEAYIRQSAV